MAYYDLERVVDHAQFATVAATDDGALFVFSKEAGETLTFEGDGPPPYLFQRSFTSQRWVKPDIPVYTTGEQQA